MATWLITGCSTGLGRSLAEAALGRGHNAFVTARDASTVKEIVDAYPDTAIAVSLDVTDPRQVSDAVRQATERFGAVDVLVNNAGYGYRAAVEEADDADIRQLFDTNFFGAVSMIKAVLPDMRARRAGAVINISSIGARICPAGSGYYSASKAALEGLSGSLRKELQPLGITVMVIEPGGFRTDFSGRSLHQSAEAIADYAETAGRRRIENDRSHGTQPGDPAKGAQVMIDTIESAVPPFLLLLGADALDGFRTALRTQLAEADTWAQTSRSTGFTT
jgi:NAD(P)-dependent dehydrogenase (short-subunit alcohol dehydrogenase family)